MSADQKARAGFDSAQRRHTLSPGAVKRVLIDADIRNSKLYQDVAQAKDALQSDLAQLQSQLECEAAERQQLQAEANKARAEVQNLQLALNEVSNQLTKNPSAKKLKDLELQLKNKDVIIEQLSNQIVALNSTGNDQSMQMKKKVQAKVSEMMRRSVVDDASAHSGRSPASQQSQSPGLKPNRKAFKASKLTLSTSFATS